MDSLRMGCFENHRVLVVDNEPEVRTRYQDLLTSRGYDVETATSGLECLEKLRSFSPDVLILDLHIPWGGGDGVLAAMRDDCRLSQVPVLLTLLGSTGTLRGIVSPQVETLTKPFSPMTLLGKVRDATRTRRRRLRTGATRPGPVAAPIRSEALRQVSGYGPNLIQVLFASFRLAAQATVVNSALSAGMKQNRR